MKMFGNQRWQRNPLNLPWIARLPAMMPGHHDRMVRLVRIVRSYRVLRCRAISGNAGKRNHFNSVAMEDMGADCGEFTTNL